MTVFSRCGVNAFTSNDNIWAYDALFQDVVDYFRHGSSAANNEKVLKTNLPPIYLQHRGRIPPDFSAPILN